jgi:IS5 family transposase
MMQRRNVQPTFVDQATSQLGGPRTSSLLDKLDALIPWQELAQPLEGLYRNGPQGGRRPWPTVMMLKCVLLAKWFGLSDPQLEETLQDRLSFRRFVGLSLEDATPDETTFVRFRGRLREAGLIDSLFEHALNHLKKQGVVLKTGTLVDATILQAPRGKKRDDGSSTRDSDASFTKKHGQVYHGYKAHIATDKRGLITGCVFDTAKVHDSRHFASLTANEPDGGQVYADSAYDSGALRQPLHRRGVFTGIIIKRRRGQQSLPAVHKQVNRCLASVRAVVEHPFAWIKNMGHRRVRYRGLERNRLDFVLMAVAYNFKRSLSLIGS